MKFDIQEVAALLHIHEKAMGHPKLKPIADVCMKHLEEIAEEHKVVPKPYEPTALDKAFEPVKEEPLEPTPEPDDSTKGSA